MHTRIQPKVAELLTLLLLLAISMLARVLLLLSLLSPCSSFAPPSVSVQRATRVRHSVATMEVQRFEVCQKKHCKKRGSVKTLALFKELAEGLPDVIVEVAP